jgi:hypothetical protein
MIFEYFIFDSWNRDVPRRKEEHLEMEKVFQQYGDGDSGVCLAILGNQY